MKRIHSSVVAGVLGIFVASSALAAGGASGTHMNGAASVMGTRTTTTTTTAPTGTPKALGQPNQTCGSATAPTTPGNSASARGSAFNPDGVSGKVYAGTQTNNTINSATNSQYDVACSHQP